MPKVRKPRARRHLAAVGSKYALAEKAAVQAAADAAAKAEDTANPFTLQKPPSSSSTSSTSSTSSDPQAAATTPADGAARPKKLTKKDKRGQRHKRFMSRLLLPGDAAKFQAKADLDMASLVEGLPTAEESVQETQKGKNMTSHTRKTIAVSEIAQFNNVLSHSAFRNNPIAALRAHLANSQDQEKKRQEQLNEIAGVKEKKAKKINFRPSAAQKRKKTKKKKSAMAD